MGCAQTALEKSIAAAAAAVRRTKFKSTRMFKAPPGEFDESAAAISGLRRALACLFVDQILLRQLAHRGLGQLGAELEFLDHLVLAELVFQEGLQFLQRERLR